MTPAVPPPTPRTRLRSYWWALFTVVAVVLAIAAYLLPYRELELSDLSPQVVAGSALLDKTFGNPISRSFKYSTRRLYSSAKGPREVEIRSTLRPMGNGLVLRQDDWYDPKSHGVVYQERYVLFRNLFSVHTRSREVAPLVHDLMGRIGWYDDSVRAIQSRQQGATPAAADWKLDLTLDRLSDTDGKGLTVQSTPYTRQMHCENAGQIDAGKIGASLSGSYPRVSCRSMTTDQPSERRSDYAYLPDQGIFLLLGFQQQADTTEALGAKGVYVSFDALP